MISKSTNADLQLVIVYKRKMAGDSGLNIGYLQRRTTNSGSYE